MSQRRWGGLGRVLAAGCLAVGLVGLAHATQLPNGEFGGGEESDLWVKVPGGVVSVDRQWLNGKWQINARWNALGFEFDNLDGSVRTIDRNGSKYLSSGGGWVYDAGNVIQRAEVAVLTPGQGEGSVPSSLAGTTPAATVGGGLATTTVTGYRWRDSRGNSIDYDGSGRAVSYANRNGVRVWLDYGPEANSRQVQKVRDHFGRTMLTFSWTNNALTAVTETPTGDAVARTVRYTWSGADLTQVTDAGGQTTRYAYANGRIASVTDPLSRVTAYAYGPTGRIDSETRADGGVTRYVYGYDKLKRQFSVRVSHPTTAAGPAVEDHTYDSDGRLVRFDLNGKTLAQETNDDGLRTRSRTDAAGRKTELTLDAYRNVIRRVQPDGAVRTAKHSPAHGGVIEEVDEVGVKTLYDYDSAGNLVRVTEAAGLSEERITTYTVDAFGRRTSVTRPGEATTYFAYDSVGNLVTITDPEGGIWQQAFDGAGNLIRLTNPLGHSWTYAWDSRGNLVSETDPNQHATRYGWDAAGQLTTVTDGRGKTVTMNYDAAGRIRQRTHADGGAFTWDYDAAGRLVGLTDGSGQRGRLERDGSGRIIKAVDGKGFEVGVGYQSEDGTDPGHQRVSKIAYPTFERQLRYNARGQLRQAVEVAGSEGLTTGYTWDARGRLVTATDAGGHTRSTVYDGLGQIAQLIDPLGGTVRFAYDGRGNLTEIQDPKGNATRLAYDRRDLPTSETDALGNVTGYTYDAAGRLTETRLANGRKIGFTYDLAGRLVARQGYGPDGASAERVDFTYDAADNLIAWTDGRSSATRSYDDADRLLEETVTIDGIPLTRRYTYYPNGQIKTYSGPDSGSIAYFYDGNGQLERIELPGEGSLTVTDWQWVAPTKITLPGGTVQEMSRDGFLNLTRLAVKSPTQSVLFELESRYGQMREITGRTVDGAATSFEYDAALHLVKADAGFLSGQSETYGLDAAGNRTTHSRVSGNWTYDAANRLLQRGQVSYSYDASGNLIRKEDAAQAEPARTTTYGYDAFNRLTEVRNGAGETVARYAYDPFDRRLVKETAAGKTLSLHGEAGLLAETDGQGAVRVSYGWHPEHDYGTYPLWQKRGGATYYYHNDALGTPWRVTDRAGQIVWAADYSPFGQATVKAGATLEQNLRLPGQYFDAETGLHYNDRRYYDPETGRYLTQDPLGIDGGLNLYAYTRHNPTTYIDPTGEFIPCVAGNYLRCMVSCSVTSGLADMFTECSVDPGKIIKDCALDCLLAMLPIPDPCGKVGKWLSAAVGVVGGLVNSFPGETEVHTPAGKVRIDALKPGDAVLAYAEWEDQTRTEKVTDVFLSHREQTVVTLTLESGDQIEATGGHPLKTPEGWRAAQLLKAGGQLDLKGPDGKLRSAKIAAVRIETKTVPVYNLEVANAHTFFVGQNGVLAHNGVVYCRTAPGRKPYFGKADSDRQRKDRWGKQRREMEKNDPGASYNWKVVYEGQETGRDLERIEQRYIDEHGGPTNKSNPNGGTANRRNNFRR